jgi:hypothetical protein
VENIPAESKDFDSVETIDLVSDDDNNRDEIAVVGQKKINNTSKRHPRRKKRHFLTFFREKATSNDVDLEMDSEEKEHPSTDIQGINDYWC